MSITKVFNLKLFSITQFKFQIAQLLRLQFEINLQNLKGFNLKYLKIQFFFNSGSFKLKIVLLVGFSIQNCPCFNI